MKKYIIPFVATTLMFSATTFAKDVDQGTLTIRGEVVDTTWICPYISRHLLSLTPLQARCRRYSRGER